MLSILFGRFYADKGRASQSVDGNVKEILPFDLAIQLTYSEKVPIIPSYGMTVAQSQKVIKEVENMLHKKSIELKYAIPPVTGRTSTI